MYGGEPPWMGAPMAGDPLVVNLSWARDPLGWGLLGWRLLGLGTQGLDSSCKATPGRVITQPNTFFLFSLPFHYKKLLGARSQCLSALKNHSLNSRIEIWNSSISTNNMQSIGFSFLMKMCCIRISNFWMWVWRSGWHCRESLHRFLQIYAFMFLMCIVNQSHHDGILCW